MLNDIYNMPLNDIISTLENDIKTAVYHISKKNLEKISLQKTRDEFTGDFTFLLFQYFSSNEFSETGEKIGLWLKENSDVVEDFEVVKGFLNLSIKNKIWLQCFGDSICDNFGHQKKNGKKLLIEYSSPNTNKPLHLGHLRNNFLGFAMSSIFEAVGYDVTQVCLVNDRGIHICKSMVAYKMQGNGTTPESEKIKGDHFVGNYYVLFDKIYREQIAELKAQGYDEEYAKKKCSCHARSSTTFRKMGTW